MRRAAVRHRQSKIFVWLRVDYNGRLCLLFPCFLIFVIIKSVIRKLGNCDAEQQWNWKATCPSDARINNFTPKFKKYIFATFQCISEVVRISSIVIFHLSKLWKAKFFIMCGVIFLLVELQGTILKLITLESERVKASNYDGFRA